MTMQVHEFPDVPDGGFRTDLEPRLSAIGSQGGRQVSSGIFRLWSHLLGHPGWITQGTSLEPVVPLPPKITQRDDLVVLANFLDELGPIGVLNAIKDSKFASSSPKTYSQLASAPNGLELIRVLIKNVCNQYTVLDTIRNKKNDFIEISTTQKFPLGLTGHFYEFMLIIAISQIIDSLRFDLSSRENFCWMEFGLGSGLTGALDLIAKSLNIPLTAASRMSLTVPADWMAIDNPRHDVLLWAEAKAALHPHRAADDETPDVARIKRLIRSMIVRGRRVPRLQEVADIEQTSVRTLARRLGSNAITFQQVLDSVRAELAEEEILAGTKSVSQISNELGFSHSSSFARAFSNWHGQSPSNWRRARQSRTQVP